MPLEEDINAFRLWATKLGCPPDAIPTEDALKTIFKSRQRGLFSNLTKRVQPLQDVREFRQNILIQKMDKIKNQVVPACTRSFLPKELQIYLKMKDLQKQKDEILSRLDGSKREYDTLFGAIKTKNMQSINIEHREEQAKCKVSLLQFKKKSLEENIKKEENYKKQINETMPVRLSEKNSNESAAMDAVEKALFELEMFYNLYHSDSNANQLQEAKDELWNKMRTIFGNVPNFLIFNSIIKLKEEQLQNIMSLNRSHLDESYTRPLSNSNCSVKDQPFTAFEMKLLKAKADVLGIVAKYLAARNERVMCEERFSKVYLPFTDDLQKKVHMINAGGTTDEDEKKHIDNVITQYIVQYNWRNFSKSQNEYLAQQIELYKQEIDTNTRQLENHEILLGSIMQVYQDINFAINRVQYEMMQLGQFKEKIAFSKNMLKHLFDDMQTTNAKSNFRTAKMKLSPNVSMIPAIGGGGGVAAVGICGDSFELSSNSVLCSTQLDFNNTTLRRSFGSNDTTFMPASSINMTGSIDGRQLWPPHLLELNTFAEIPLEKFNCMPKECAFYLTANPLIVESTELSSTIQLAPGTLLTSYGAVQEVRNRIVWSNLIAEHSNDLKLDLEVVSVNAQDLKLMRKKQHDHIVELLDRINVTGINTQRTLRKAGRIFDFMVANPLRHYIPNTKTFNNQTYADYEAEYTMYYRMGASMK